jgi:hypothetical protein
MICVLCKKVVGLQEKVVPVVTASELIDLLNGNPEHIMTNEVIHVDHIAIWIRP